MRSQPFETINTKHTPGPWVGLEQGDANEFVLLTNQNKWLFSFRQNGEKWTEEQRANLQLIAAAPENIVDIQKVRSLLAKCLETMPSGNERAFVTSTLFILNGCIARSLGSEYLPTNP